MKTSTSKADSFQAGNKFFFGELEKDKVGQVHSRHCQTWAETRVPL